ncbi:uncharacterized protein [Drosophila virilis]|uniref:Uncharacterized protein n=1 Tax=Drosophila virilis TaxID=7244 RepID=B4LZZ1_DROVI|nr:uncharacterized protein LOC6630270 [Drosophila virilis]EDW67219.2 uncharacterized protein Dvir_GJ24038 [Drosophila virilis]
MERRCIVCGQTPTSGFTHPHNMAEAVNWQNMLSCFVPVETLLHHCCVCNKHINRSQVQQSQKQKETRVDDLIEQRRGVTFNNSDAVLYFGEQGKEAPHSCTQSVNAMQTNELQTENGSSGTVESAQLLNNSETYYRSNYVDTAIFNIHPGLPSKVNNVAATNPREEDMLDSPWATRRTSGNETYASRKNNQCVCGSSCETIDSINAGKQAFETKRAVWKHPIATSSSAVAPSCICGSSCPRALTAKKPMLNPQRMAWPAGQSFDSSRDGSSGFPVNVCNNLDALQKHKQHIQQQLQQQLQKQQQRQRSQQNRQCQCCLTSRVRDQAMQCPSQKFNQVPAAQEDKCICCPQNCIDNTSSRNDRKVETAPMSSTIPNHNLQPYKFQQNRKPTTDMPSSPPVSVLIMGGSMLPTYCNKTSFRAQPSNSSEICVLESDLTREGAVFPDIDEPNYTVCRALAEPTNDPNGLSDQNSTEVLLLGIAQPEKFPCFEREENKSLLAKLAQQVVEHNAEATGTSKEQEIRLDELERLLTQQRQLQQSIQAKLKELQGRKAPATPRMSAGIATRNSRMPLIRTGPNPTRRILPAMSSNKTK